MEQKGSCKHGEFNLVDGCKKCIEEARKEREALQEQPKQIVKVRYYSETTGELSAKEYTYYSAGRLAVGDIVTVPVRDTIGKAKVSAIDVPEVEIANFRDKVKTIPVGSLVKAEIEFTPLKHTEAEMEMIEERSAIQAESLFPSTLPAERTAMVKIAPGKDADVIKLLDEVMHIKEYADSRVISSGGDLKSATDDLTIMGGLKKAIEDKRKEYVGPLNDHVKAVNDAFKLLTGPLGEADGTTRKKVVEYRQEMERRQREAEEINRQKEELARKEAALNQGVVTVNTEPVEVVEAPTVTRTNVGTSGMVDNWNYRIVDLEKLPREYMMPDDAMLKSIAKTHHDKKQVPGVEFYNDPTLRVSKRQG